MKTDLAAWPKVLFRACTRVAVPAGAAALDSPAISSGAETGRADDFNLALAHVAELPIILIIVGSAGQIFIDE